MADTAELRRKYLFGAGALVIFGLIAFGVIDYTKSFYPSDFEAMLDANPDQNFFVINQNLKGEINVLSRTNGNDYTRYKITKSETCTYESAALKGCYSFKVSYKPTDAIRKRYGYPEYVNLMRKASLVKLNAIRVGETVIVSKVSQFYAGSTASGSDGALTEKLDVTQLGAEYSVVYVPGMATRIHKLDLVVTDLKKPGKLPIGFADGTTACFGNAPKTYCLEWYGAQNAFDYHEFVNGKLTVHFRDAIGTIRMGVV